MARMAASCSPAPLLSFCQQPSLKLCHNEQQKEAVPEKWPQRGEGKENLSGGVTMAAAPLQAAAMLYDVAPASAAW